MTQKSNRIFANIAWVFCLLVAIVLGIKSLREPDIWWQLRTGEWIIRHHAVPFNDIFSFTYAGTPWINVKWGFEVLMQCMVYIGGPEFTPVLQCIADILILIFVLKTYKTLKFNVLGANTKYPSASIVFGALVLLFICAFRFIGRPEMASHVMVVVFILFIVRDYYKPSKNILWLIPLQILWANLHEAYGTGTVMIITAGIAGWIDYFIWNKGLMIKELGVEKSSKSRKAQSETNALPKRPVPLWLSIAVIGVILAPAVHPYGWTMIIHPFNIFSQVESNKFTSELVGYTDPMYWHMEAYLNVILFGLALIFLFLKSPASKGIRWYFRPVKTYGVAYPTILILFFYLSLTAYRNIPFFIIAVIPLFALGLDIIYESLKGRFVILRNQALIISGYVVVILLGIGFYLSIVTGEFYKVLEGDHDSYGLKINAYANPIGSAKFIRDHQLKGNCFTDFLVSSYLLWDLQPDFKTFIDLRDLDVFPADFFKHVNLLEVQPQLIENIDKVAHFKYAVILRKEFPALQKYLCENPDWRAVYADPVSAVYVKKDTTDQNVMSLFNAAAKDVPFHAPVIPQNSAITKAVSRIFWPLYDPDKQENVDIDLIAANYYETIGHLDAALASAKKSASNNIANWDGEDMTGNIYMDMAAGDTVKANQQKDFNLATDAFNKALGDNPKDDASYIGLGLLSLNSGDPYAAKTSFEQALKIDKDNYLTYWDLANCENYFARTDAPNALTHFQARLKYLKKAYSLNQDQRIRFYLGIAYGQNDDCDNCRKYLDENTMHYPGIPQPDRKLAKEMLQNCGKE